MGLAKQFKEVLSQKFGNEVAVFDYAADFSAFWDEKDRGAGLGLLPAPEIIKVASTSTQKALIIVWDGIPDDNSVNEKLLAPHLTPLDWALSFAMQMIEQGKVNYADFSIHIIDLTVNAYEDAFVLRMRDTLLAEMPWVTLYAPLVPIGKNGKPVRYRRCYKNIADLIPKANADGQPQLFVMPTDVLTMANSLKGQEEPVKQALSRVANAWRASLIQSDDHHDLNNLIGATVASGGDDNSPLIRAFCKRLEFSGHLSQSYLAERNKAVDGVIDVVNADILVIDDMLSMGWDRYLCKALGAKHEAGTSFGLDKFVQFGIQGSLKLHGCLSAAALIESWKNKPPRLEQRNFSHRFLPDSDKTTHGEILFLDLRLGDTQKIKAQVMTLLGIFGDSLTNTQSLAWTAIDQDEQERIKNWCGEPNASEDADGFVDAITLLPRICALINPLVPVILFSSTARADVKQKLSSYRNVFCGFEKPQVLQQPESVRQSILGLRHQLRDCKKLIEFRRSLAFVEEQAEEARMLRTPIAPDFESVECFIDESEKRVGRPDSNNSKLLSGSFVLIASGDNIAQAIDQDLRLTELITTKYSPGANTPDEHVLLRKRTRENVLPKLEAFADKSKKICVGFQIDDLQMTQVSMDLFGDNHPERKLDYLLRFLIDFQGVVLPWYLGYSSNAAKFCFDERSLPASDQTEMYDRETRYALKAIPDAVENKNKTYSAGSYFPIIREAMLRWPNSWWKLNPHTARGYSLTNHLQVSHCHYLADWVAGALREGNWGFLDGIVDNGHIYSVDATGNKFWLLESFRFAAHGACEEAIVYLLLHGGITGPVPCLDEPRNAKVEQILLLGIYDHALQIARGDALFQALSADKNSRKSGLQSRSSGIPEKYSDEEVENSISQPDEIIDGAVNNQQSLTIPVSVEEPTDENQKATEKHSLTVVEVLQSATPSGWTVEDSSNKRFFLRS